MIIQTNGFIKTKGADFYKVLINGCLLATNSERKTDDRAYIVNEISTIVW